MKTLKRFTCLLMILPSVTIAEEALIAVAANFRPVLDDLRVEFESSSRHRLNITSGSTGQLYAQITNGAPYDMLLAADQERPALLAQSVFGVAESRFTYATGRLAVWSADSNLILSNIQDSLLQERVRSVAIANPALAPYGVAARQSLAALDVWDLVAGNIVMGENVGQVHALVATGNAEIGVVALSFVLESGSSENAGFHAVPDHLHAPIRQDAILLQRGSRNEAAIEFMTFLRYSRIAHDLIASSGYGAG